MASSTPLLKPHAQIIIPTNSSSHFSLKGTLFLPLQFAAPQPQCHCSISFFPLNQKPPYSRPKAPRVSLQSSFSSSTPPTSKEEAILQAKTCLSKALEKPLNNPNLTGKLKKIRQPRFRVEIPVIDEDSPVSISQLALDVLGDLPIKRKGSTLRILILWPNSTLTEVAIKAFETQKPSNQVQHMNISAVTNGDIRILNSADLAVFFVPEASQLAILKTVTEGLDPKPVVVFNPSWGFEEEDDFGELRSFVGSFGVVYSFSGLEVRGIISKRKGMIFKCAEDGVLSGERWTVLVEEDGGELKVVSRFKARPSIGEVENVLYNKMAINSPLTKSAKFLRDLVSNVTGKK